ncbi:MAG TPA: sugar ABC transporter permease [Acidimicrobiia bacterium]|jgi:raffinose/stachyose/melibiose transport system permease protein|nr:sugar ABC transporter permease [Acidimicrobiia bacterium]
MLYLLPAFAVYAVFFLWPTWQMARLSFFHWDGVTVGSVAGLENYTRMGADPLFWTALTNTATWTLAAMVVPVVLGLGLAILLSRSALFGTTLFRTLFFLPQVLSSVVVAVLWRWIYNPSYGALNSTLESLGLDFLAQGWLGSSSLALPALFIAWSWTHYGFVMVVLMAAIDDVDETYFDAAAVDGASFWQQVRHVLVPAIRGPLTTVILITAIAAFQVFDLVYLLTNGGPARSTSVLAHFMFQAAFHFRKVGYGATIGVALMVMILAISLVLIRVRRGFEEEVV